VNSPVRAFRHVGTAPVVLAGGKGAEVVDRAGKRFIDCIMGWGALVLGHNPPPVVAALRRQASRGVLLGLTHPGEMELARLIVNAVPSVEQVRFTVSGTEACMTAVKLARAATGRSTILVLDGGYHGHADALMGAKSAGVPAAVDGAIVRVPMNDPAALEEAVARCRTDLACAIVEPVAANIGVIEPTPGWLARVRDVTRRCEALLILDEVVTGFRLRYGAIQDALHVQPDLTVFGKIIGGGLPIGAIGGPARLMRRLSPEGDVYHGGTFAGHPLSMACGIATLKALKRPAPYRRLEAHSRRLSDGLLDAARASGVPLHVNRVGSMLTVFFSSTPVRSAAEARASRTDLFAQWAKHLRASGILIPPSPFEALFLSTAHTEAHVERILKASRAAFGAMRSDA
jgi:glutamate-1-semialdehyde 2,1-aminomutase